MSCYDPRELCVRLEISRNYNVEITKQRDKIRIEYKNLLDKYHELVKYFVMDKDIVCDECLDSLDSSNIMK